MDEKKPWEISPALTEERLRFLGEMLVQIRAEVMKAQEPEKGDGAWDGGCRAYARTCFSLVVASESGALPWLYAVYLNNSLLQIELRVAGVPLIYFRGDSQNPAMRHVYRAPFQMSLFPDATDDVAYCWAMILEADREGNPLRVVVAQLNEAGETRNRWIAAEVRQQSNNVVPMTKEGPDLPPPVIKGPSSKAQTQGESGTRDGTGS
jgi:hypothetical protein